MGKLEKPGFITITQLARELGVSQSAVSQAVQNGRLRAYDGAGKSVPLGYAARKWLKPTEAAEDWHNSRLRFDDNYLDG
jgi:excisionase family DNA binding protein